MTHADKAAMHARIAEEAIGQGTNAQQAEFATAHANVHATLALTHALLAQGEVPDLAERQRMVERIERDRRTLPVDKTSPAERFVLKVAGLTFGRENAATALQALVDEAVRIEFLFL